jgi:hypothetical protein
MYRNEIRCIVLRKKCYAERKDVTIKKKRARMRRCLTRKQRERKRCQDKSEIRCRIKKEKELSCT